MNFPTLPEIYSEPKDPQLNLNTKPLGQFDICTCVNSTNASDFEMSQSQLQQAQAYPALSSGPTLSTFTASPYPSYSQQIPNHSEIVSQFYRGCQVGDWLTKTYTSDMSNFNDVLFGTQSTEQQWLESGSKLMFPTLILTGDDPDTAKLIAANDDTQIWDSQSNESSDDSSDDSSTFGNRPSMYPRVYNNGGDNLLQTPVLGNNTYPLMSDHYRYQSSHDLNGPLGELSHDLCFLSMSATQPVLPTSQESTSIVVANDDIQMRGCQRNGSTDISFDDVEGSSNPTSFPGDDIDTPMNDDNTYQYNLNSSCDSTPSPIAPPSLMSTETKPSGYYCQKGDSAHNSKRFNSKASLKRHENTVHTKPEAYRFPCTMDGCSRRFNRQDNLLVHLRSVHSQPIEKQRNRRQGSSSL